MTPDPFDTLGLPARPDLDDEQVRAAWRTIAAATHPDRPDGGDLAWYTQASAAYAELRTAWGRSEAYADRADRAGRAGRDDAGPDTAPLPAIRGDSGRPARGMPLAVLLTRPARVWHGRPLRLLVRAAVTAGLAIAVLALIGGQSAAPADVAGLILWFVLTGRRDLAPPPER